VVVVVHHRDAAGFLREIAQAARRLLQIRPPLALIHVLARVHHTRQATRIDGEQAGIGAIGGERQLLHQEKQVGVGPDAAQPEIRVLHVDQLLHGIPESPPHDPVLALPPFGERIEVVAGADVDHGLSSVANLIQRPHQAVHRLEGHLRAEADVAGTTRRLQHLEDLGGRRGRSADARGRRGNQLVIQGGIDLDGRRAARHHRHHVALVQQRVHDLLDDAAHVGRELGLEVQVVHEDDEHAPRLGRVRRAAGGRKDDAFGGLRRRRREQVERSPAVDHHERLDALLHAILQDREVVLREVGHEAAILVARDGVGRDQRDVRPERGLLDAREWGLGRCRRLGGEHRASGTEHGKSWDCAHRVIIRFWGSGVLGFWGSGVLGFGGSGVRGFA